MSSRRKKDWFFLSMKKWFITLFSLALIYFVMTHYIEWIQESNTLQLKHIEIQGNEIIEDQEIIEMGRIPVDSCIWQVDLHGLSSTIAQNPYVERVQVHRVLPDKIQIGIKEKQPVALLNFRGQLYCLDRFGLVMPTKPGKLYDLPIVSGQKQGKIQLGHHIRNRSIEEGLRFIEIILDDRPDLFGHISEIIAGGEKGLILRTRQSGIPVWIGENQYRMKVRYLEAILDKLQKQNATPHVHYIDLRFQGRVFVGMRV
jgi:cell division protein FtsQ